MIIAFKRRVKDQKMVEKLATWVIRNTIVLFELANKCAQAAEAQERQIDSRSHPTSDHPASSKGVDQKDKKSKQKADLPRSWQSNKPDLHADASKRNTGEKVRATA